MTNDEFKKVLDRRILLIKQVLSVKASEYARGDRLSNFKAGASLEKTIPIVALRGMMTKHIIALYDFIKDWEQDQRVQNYDRWDEKIGDIINYLILMDAIVREFLTNNNISLPE